MRRAYGYHENEQHAHCGESGNGNPEIDTKIVHETIR
jgi:hypothetical protein